MGDITPKMENRVRWIHEFLFSLNVAWMVEWYARLRSRTDVPWVKPSWFTAEVSQILQRVYWALHMIDPVTVIVQVAWAVGFALIVFLIVCLLRRFSATVGFLRIVAGAFALAGFPLYALFVPSDFFDPSRIESNEHWLYLEVFVVLIWAILYYLHKWLLTTPLSFALLISHFGLWLWATENVIYRNVLPGHFYSFWTPAYWISTMFYFGFPVIGLLSSMAWYFYVDKSFAKL